MKKIATLFFVLAVSCSAALSAQADGVYQTLPFSQDWTNIGMITMDDDWSGVPGVLGYRGDNLTPNVDTDPQTILADDVAPVLDINANKPDPLAFFSGGLAEFELLNPVVALTGSGTADAPYMVLHVDATDLINITVSYNLRDLEGDPGTDNAVQQIALHYRTGPGAWTNVPAAYVADATTTPPALPSTTPVLAVLPVDANGAATLQIRVMTTNAGGNDEWVGVDDILVTGEPAPVKNEATSWSKLKVKYR